MSNTQEFQWDDKNIISIINAALNNQKDFVMNSKVFLSDFKQSKLSKQQTKDYEILTMWRNNDEQTIHNYITEEMIQKGSEPCEEHDCKIYSVKRTSDNEVFSIGDAIKNEEYNFFAKIGSFYISNNLMFINAVNDNNDYLFHCPIKVITKQKQKVLTTEDGVDIFEEDKFYVVELKWMKYVGASIYPSFSNTFNKCTHKFFSTREKAEEYILLNKPCLSVNDIIYSIFKSQKIGSLTNAVFTISSNDLIELAKQKINNNENN